MSASHIPTDHEIETYSGRFVDVSDPSDTCIVLEDIAHALGNICRFGGHCKTFYSVAEHAVFVSKRLERMGETRYVQYAGLHHDDSEAFLGDIPRPIKPLLGNAYKRMTDKVDMAISRMLYQYGPPWVNPESFHLEEVKVADTWALMVEARHLLPSEGRMWMLGAQGAQAWDLEVQPTRIVTPDYWLGGVDPGTAAKLFLARHRELTEERTGS